MELFHNVELYAGDEGIGARQGLHLDGSFTSDRAVVFAHAAPDAQIAQHMRAKNCQWLDQLSGNVNFFQGYGFFRQRAHFFAHTAKRVISPWKAAVGVDGRESNGCLLFYFF